jgi:hypothetical protein
VKSTLNEIPVSPNPEIAGSRSEQHVGQTQTRSDTVHLETDFVGLPKGGVIISPDHDSHSGPRWTKCLWILITLDSSGIGLLIILSSDIFPQSTFTITFETGDLFCTGLAWGWNSLPVAIPVTLIFFTLFALMIDRLRIHIEAQNNGRFSKALRNLPLLLDITNILIHLLVAVSPILPREVDLIDLRWYLAAAAGSYVICCLLDNYTPVNLKEVITSGSS